MRIDTDLIGPDYTRATLKGTLDVSPEPPTPTGDHKLKVVLRSKKEGKVIKESTLVAGKDPLNWKLDSGVVEGWYPVGYGKQPLYDLEISLLDEVSTILYPDFKLLQRERLAYASQSATVIATSNTRVAFRHAEVVQDKLDNQEGTTFLFEVNGVRVFCGGSNWIPSDSFLTEIEPGRYRRWVELLVREPQPSIS